MRNRFALSLVALIIVVWTAPQTALAQKDRSAPKAAKKSNPLLKLAEAWPEPAVLEARRTDAQQRPLFQDTAPLPFTLAADFKLINKDRNPESTNQYPGLLSITDARGREQTIHVQLSPRGHFRRMARNCAFVPIRIDFPKDEVAGTPFEGQNTLKLGTHCQDEKEYEQYVLREYLTYPMFNLVTPLSFRARLARGTYVDAQSKKSITTRYAIFIEHDSDVARRSGGRIVELQRLKFEDVDPTTLNTMMLFEYMIGNTDFSLYALHNLRVVQDPTRKLFPVPYDFDLSGFVNPSYAIPDRRLGIRSVRDRLYRGPCRTADELDTVAKAFRSKQADMIALVNGMRDLDGPARSDAKDYLDAFFRAISEPSAIKRSLVNGCRPNPTM